MTLLKQKFSEEQRNVRYASQQVSLPLLCQSQSAAETEVLTPDACRIHGSQQVVGRVNEVEKFRAP